MAAAAPPSPDSVDLGQIHPFPANPAALGASRGRGSSGRRPVDLPPPGRLWPPGGDERLVGWASSSAPGPSPVPRPASLRTARPRTLVDLSPHRAGPRPAPAPYGPAALRQPGPRPTLSSESVRGVRIRTTTLARLHGFVLLPSEISVAGTGNAMK